MFGDLLGKAQEQKEEMLSKLKEIELEETFHDGAIGIKVNAAREILDIKIDKSKLDYEDTEQLQDLLVDSLNRALKMAAEREAEEAQSMIKDMLPPGFGGLFGR